MEGLGFIKLLDLPAYVALIDKTLTQTIIIMNLLQKQMQIPYHFFTLVCHAIGTLTGFQLAISYDIGLRV
jgi:hypothetical protein